MAPSSGASKMSPSKPVAVDGMLWQLVTRAIAFVSLV